MTQFILDFIHSESSKWSVKPEVFTGDELQDSVVLVFGKPNTALFAHMDSIGFTVGYNNQLIRIGSPVCKVGIELVGRDSKGEISGKITEKQEDEFYIYCDRTIDRGTNLTFKPDFRLSDNFIQCCYLDNRLGVYTALEIAATLENGIIVFGCYEEHHGGSAASISRWIWENYRIKQALISDITWSTEGVKHGKGAAISMRDSGIPRRKYLNKIIDLAQQSGIPFQLEVESAGGSDGTEIQKSPYPIDWVFIGAPESQVHSPNEKVYISDLISMIELTRYLMSKL
jgi:putative aminopeptidase FrvX